MPPTIFRCDHESGHPRLTQQTVALSYAFKSGWSKNGPVMHTVKPLYHCRVEDGKPAWQQCRPVRTTRLRRSIYKLLKNSDLISTHLKVCGFTVAYIKRLTPRLLRKWRRIFVNGAVLRTCALVLRLLYRLQYWRCFDDTRRI